MRACDRPPDEGRTGAERKCLQHVRAAADAAVHVHLAAIADRLGHLRQRVEPGGDPVQLPAAVVRHVHGRGTVLDREQRVFSREDALEHDREAAFGGDPLEVVPRQRRARLEVLAHRLGERRRACPDVRQRQVVRNLEAELQVTLAPAEKRHVDGQDESRVAALATLGDVVERPLPVAQDVELEPPRRVTGRLGDVGVRARGDRRDAEERVRGGRGACGRELALGVEQPLHREGRNAERHRDGRPEERRLERDRADVDEHPRPQPPARVRGGVGPKRHLVAGAALEVAPDLRVDRLRSPLEVVGDVDRVGHDANLSRAFAAIWRSPP